MKPTSANPISPTLDKAIKPTLVHPVTARQIMQIGQTKLYALINEGQLRSVKIGRARRIFLDSIEELIGREVTEPTDGVWKSPKSRALPRHPPETPEAALYSHGNAGSARLERDLALTGQANSPKKPISFSNAPAMVEKNNGN